MFRRRKKKQEGDGEQAQKYNSSKVIVTDDGQIIKQTKENKGKMPGQVFHSRQEAEYFLVLVDKLRKGEITDLRLQPKFTLQDAFYHDGKKILAIEYVPDFEIVYPNERIVYIDVKGHEDAQFKIKHKMFKFRYRDHELLLLKKVSKFGGWITVAEYDEKKAEENKRKKEAEKAAENF